VGEVEVELAEIERPAGLLATEILHSSPVLEIAMVSYDVECLRKPFEVMLPILQHVDDA